MARRAAADVSMQPLVILDHQCLGTARMASSNRVVVFADNAFTIGVEVGNYDAVTPARESISK